MALGNQHWVMHVRVYGFLRTVLARFIADRCLPGAGALSYTTIVSLVPLIAIGLSVFSAFPIFGPLRAKVLDLIAGNLAPEIGQESVAVLTGIADHAASTTVIGVLALAVTAIMLLATIEEALQHIFRDTTPRGWGHRVVAYWTVLTLGPVALGALLSVTGDIGVLLERLEASGYRVEATTRAWTSHLSFLLPILLETASLILLFRLIPNRKMPWLACAAGALVAAIGLGVLNLAFGFYIDKFATYNAIYGALAGVPVLLLWMYIFWAAVLFGAEVTACVTEDMMSSRDPYENGEPPT